MEKKQELASAKAAAAHDETQQAILEFLADPQTYSHNVQSVSRVETHAAIVFLAGERAYKLKRAIKLPYLDFSTPEKRRAVIERELEINLRETPELYLQVLPVTRTKTGKGFELGGTGEAADWLLVMRRFDEDALLASIASKGQLNDGLLAGLAATIEHFHRGAVRMPGAGFAQSLEAVVANLDAALCGADAANTGLCAAPIIERLYQELNARQALIAEREHEGFVRRCHGDLHLGNIVLWEGRPRLFDAIEFDERLATIDVLYDLAFLLMDLWHRGLRQEANLVLNHYFERAAMSELAGLALLPLFLALRAAIRAMTALHRLKVAPHNSTAESEALSYVSLAASLIAPERPSLVAIGGISGTGKTSAAREAAALIGAAPGALVLRTDVERKVMQGVPLDFRLSSGSYTAEARDEVYRRVFKKAEAALNCGHSVIVDAVFPEHSARTSLCELAHRTNACFWGFWLEADPSVVRKRISARSGGASDADTFVAETQQRTVEPPEGWIKVDASGPIHSVSAAILKTFWSRAA